MQSPYTYRLHPIEVVVESLYDECGVKTPGDITLYLWDRVVHVMVVHRPGNTNTARMRDTHVIFLDGDKPLPIRRVEMAHEIGHVLLHCGDQEEMPPYFTAKQEREADLFSHYALAPTYLLEDSIVSAGVERDELVPCLSELYCVPAPFMHERLEIYVKQTISSTRAKVAEQQGAYVIRSTADREVEYVMSDDGYTCLRRRKKGTR